MKGQLKKSGTVQLEGKLANQDLWQYLLQKIVPSIRDSAILDDGTKKRVEIELQMVFEPGTVPINISYEDGGVQMLLIPEPQRRLINGMFKGVADIFSTLVDKAWMFVGVIKQPKREIPIVIISFDHLDQAIYSLIDTDTMTAMKDYRHLLN